MKDIIELRLSIDEMINTVTVLTSPSREISLARTSLQRAKAFLGKVLGESGSPTPYPNSENPENLTIDKQADHNSATVDSVLKFTTQIERVKKLRSLVGDIESKMRVMLSGESPGGYFMRLFFEQSFIALVDAKMWLGWELDAIRNKQG